MWAEGNSNSRCQNWNYRLNKMLAEANIVYDPGVTNPRIFKAKLAEHLYQNLIHSWVEDINRNNARQGNDKNNLRTYKTYKNDYRTEQYLQCLMPHCHRSAYSKFRCGVPQFAWKRADMNVYLKKGGSVLIV